MAAREFSASIDLYRSATIRTRLTPSGEQPCHPAATVNQPDAGPFDLLYHLAFNAPPAAWPAAAAPSPLIGSYVDGL